MFDPSPLYIKHYCAIMDDSVNIHFQEALIANDVTSEKEVNELCDKFNSILSAKKPAGYLNVLMLPSRRSRRFSQSVGFWEVPSYSDPPVTTTVPVTVNFQLPLQARSDSAAKKTIKKKYINPLLGFAARVFLSELESLL